MNNNLEEQLKKATEKLSGEVVQLQEDIIVKYTVLGVEYVDKLAKGILCDTKIVRDEEFRMKFFILNKIIEIM